MSYEDTKVTVSSSREGIAKVLCRWGAAGVMWEDDLKTGGAVLRFRWKHGNDELVARLKLEIDRAGIGAAGTKKRESEIERRRRGVHRVAFWWLNAQDKAVKAGLFDPETVIIPWLEDGNGVTIGEALAPHLGAIGRADVSRRLQLPEVTP